MAAAPFQFFFAIEIREKNREGILSTLWIFIGRVNFLIKLNIWSPPACVTGIVNMTTMKSAHSPIQSIQSPFDPLSTHLLSPVVAYGMTVYLYKPLGEQSQQSEPEYYQTAYDICVKSTRGYITIRTISETAYTEAVIYLCRAYRSVGDENDEYILWEL